MYFYGKDMRQFYILFESQDFDNFQEREMKYGNG